MGDQHPEESDEPSLELPSLFRRRRRRPSGPATAQEPPHTEAGQPLTPRDDGTSEALPSPAEQLVDAQDETAGPSYVVEEAARPQEERVAEDRPDEGREPRRLSLPAPPALVAVGVTGLVVGLAGTALIVGGLEGCQVVRGTSSCGGPGLLFLVVIVGVMALIGSALLAVWGVSDPRATSVLGVGIVCVVAMVALLEVVFSRWMFLAIPALGAASYLLAHWVTARAAVELDDRPRTLDVR